MLHVTHAALLKLSCRKTLDCSSYSVNRVDPVAQWLVLNQVSKLSLANVQQCELKCSLFFFTCIKNYKLQMNHKKNYFSIISAMLKNIFGFYIFNFQLIF